MANRLPKAFNPMHEKTNASQAPKIFYARHMQPGNAKYDDETILVDVEGMRNLISTGVGIPVYVGHQEVNLKNLQQEADGYVTESFYNETDGWAWFKFLAVGDKAHSAIAKGWAVSNAYRPTVFGEGGTKNNVPYHREVRGGEFTHLAIVPDPRYEGACIMTPDDFKIYQDEQKKKLAAIHQNSKGEKTMFKIFKTERKEVSTIDMDSEIELENGKSVSIREMVEAVVENSKSKEQFVEVDGKKISVAELVNSYSKLNAKKKTKKNGEETVIDLDMDKEESEGDQDVEGDDEIGDDKKNKKAKMKKNKKEKKNADMDEDMENAEEEDCMNEDEDEKKKEKKNSVDTDKTDIKFFNQLKNAHLTVEKQESPQLIHTSIDQLERGKQRYGSGK